MTTPGNLGGRYLHPDFGSIAGGNYGIPYNIVDSSNTPLVPVAVTLYPDESDIMVSPFPAFLTVEGNPVECAKDGNDRHLIVIDRKSCVAYELYQGSHCNGAWSGSQSTIWDFTQTEKRPYTFTSADAAGLSVFEGLVRYDEIVAGVINHAIRFTANHTKNNANNGYFTAPATHAAGTLWGTDNIIGMRIRLKANFDISSFSATNQTILKAMKQYGMILADNGSDMYFQGTPDTRWNDNDLSALKTVPSSAFDVIQMGPVYDSATAPTGVPPVILSFVPSASTISLGSSVVLTPNVTGASYSYIDNAGFANGPVTVTPLATTTYTLTSRNAYGSTSSSTTVTVQLIPTTTLAISPIPDQVFGAAPIQLSATTNSSGVITYSVVSGPATISGQVLTIAGTGIVTVKASVAASGVYIAAIAQASFNVVKASTLTTLNTSANPLPVGSSVTFTAGITSGATGTVTFTDGGSTMCSATLSAGVATCSASSLSTGFHNIVATYAGDNNFSGSSSAALIENVLKASTVTTLSSSANPIAMGSAVTFTAGVTTGTTGTVTFSDAGSTLCSATLSAGIATCSSSALTAGTHSIVATYAGDSNFSGSSSPALIETVLKAATSTTLSSSANPISIGSVVTFTAGLTTGATGIVTFADNGSTLCSSPILVGAATCTASSLLAGSHSILATYAGDTSFSGSSSPALTETVLRASTSTTLSSSANPTPANSTVIFTAGVTAGATGTVTFADGGSTLCSTALSASSATCSAPSLSAGTHTIVATYAGDTNFSGSLSPALIEDVFKTPTSTTLTSSANPVAMGLPVTFTASVITAATGTVTFTNDGSTLCLAALSAGIATCSSSSISAGSHSIVAAYAGDTNFLGSSSTALTQNVLKATTVTTLSTSANPIMTGSAVTLTAIVTTGATGTVSFADSSSTLCAAPISAGIATCLASALSAGPHSIVAAYNGDSNFSGSSSTALTETVLKASTSTTLTSSANPITIGSAVTFMAAVSSGATGTVTFTDSASALCSATLSSGVATCLASSLSTGAHSIVATYAGDTNFSGSASAALTEVVQDFTISVPTNGSSQTTNLGGSASYIFTVNPSTSPFVNAVSFTVTGLPAGVTAEFSPASFAQGLAASSTTMTVHIPTTLAVKAPQGKEGFERIAFASLFLFPIASWMGLRRRRGWRYAGVFITTVSTLAVFVLVGCSTGTASSSNQQTSSPVPRTYTLTVAATSGTVSHAAVVTLTVI